MLNWSFDSKKSEVVKVERFIRWSAIEPKAPRQQQTQKQYKITSQFHSGLGSNSVPSGWKREIQRP